jgi:hypothetical protein
MLSRIFGAVLILCLTGALLSQDPWSDGPPVEFSSGAKCKTTAAACNGWSGCSKVGDSCSTCTANGVNIKWCFVSAGWECGLEDDGDGHVNYVTCATRMTGNCTAVPGGFICVITAVAAGNCKLATCIGSRPETM